MIILCIFKKLAMMLVFENDIETVSQAMSCNEFELWHKFKKDEMISMAPNGIWDLILPNSAKVCGYE